MTITCKLGRPSSTDADSNPYQDRKPVTESEMNPWTAWISQIKLNEQEVPEFSRTSDAMKQTWSASSLCARRRRCSALSRQAVTKRLRSGNIYALSKAFHLKKILQNQDFKSTHLRQNLFLAVLSVKRVEKPIFEICLET